MRWADFSNESQELILAYLLEPKNQDLDTVKSALRAYPELKRSHPQLMQVKKAGLAAASEDRWDSYEPRWRELGKEMQAETIADTLRHLDEGRLDSVENNLQRFPPLQSKDPRLQEIWVAMQEYEPRQEEQSGWDGLTEVSQRYVLEAALRQLETDLDNAKHLVQDYPELKELDVRLASLN